MENPYIKQIPDLMSGKKIMYVHGFLSSGQSGTVKMLQELMPNATLIAEDIPVHPEEAVEMLKKMQGHRPYPRKPSLRDGQHHEQHDGQAGIPESS